MHCVSDDGFVGEVLTGDWISEGTLPSLCSSVIRASLAYDLYDIVHNFLTLKLVHGSRKGQIPYIIVDSSLGGQFEDLLTGH